MKAQTEFFIAWNWLTKTSDPNSDHCVIHQHFQHKANTRILKAKKSVAAADLPFNKFCSDNSSAVASRIVWPKWFLQRDTFLLTNGLQISFDNFPSTKKTGFSLDRTIQLRLKPSPHSGDQLLRSQYHDFRRYQHAADQWSVRPSIFTSINREKRSA